MMLIGQGLTEAVALLARGDPQVLRIAGLTLLVSLAATALSLLVGVPFGTLVALSRFPGRRLLVTATHTGMGLPPVTVGLIVTLLLWRSGPFGWLELLYTPAAIVLAQTIIALPLVTGLTVAAVGSLPAELAHQLQSLGAAPLQLLRLLLHEARLPLLAAVAAGFGSVVSEVGASMMVGGNIHGQTRVLTTATVLETQRGRFDLALAYSIVLLALVFVFNAVLIRLRSARRG
ncbi:MAG TPA: ABC transporter permease [Acidobacteriota bacterium]